MKDLARLREDGLGAYTLSQSGLQFASPDHPQEAPEYRFVDDEEAEYLERTGFFEVASGDRLETILGGTAEQAAEAIETGHADNILDLVLIAEREGDDRTTVKDAIEERQEVFTQ